MNLIQLQEDAVALKRRALIRALETEFQGSNAFRGVLERSQSGPCEESTSFDEWDDWLDGDEHADSDSDEDDDD